MANDSLWLMASMAHVSCPLFSTRFLCLLYGRFHVVGMICLRDLTCVIRNYNDNFPNDFTAFLRRIMSNKSIFFGLLTTITSELRYLLRGFIRRLLRFRITRATALMINFRFIRVQVFKRVGTRIFQATGNVRMDRCNITFRFSKILRARIIKINVRTLRLLLRLINEIQGVSAITRTLTRLNFTIHSQRTRTNYVIKRRSFQFRRNFAVCVIRATCSFADLFGRQLLIFTRKRNDNTRNNGIHYLTSKMNRRACKSTYLRVARLSFNLCHQITLRTTRNRRIRVMRNRFTRFQCLKLSRSNALHQIRSTDRMIRYRLSSILTRLFQVLRVIHRHLYINSRSRGLIMRTKILRFRSSSR